MGEENFCACCGNVYKTGHPHFCLNCQEHVIKDEVKIPVWEKTFYGQTRILCPYSVDGE